MIRPEDFDPEIVREYGITPRKLELVLRYVRLMQGEDSLTLRDIAAGGHYGTSALLHEVVELDILLRREPRLLSRTPKEVHRLFELSQDAHSQALAVECRYLQETILRCFKFTTGHFFPTLGLDGTSRPEREETRYCPGAPDVPSGVSEIELEKVSGNKASNRKSIWGRF